MLPGASARQAPLAPPLTAADGVQLAQQKPWAEEVLEAIGRRRGGSQPTAPGPAPQGGERGQGGAQGGARQESPPVGAMPRGQPGGQAPGGGAGRGPDR